MPESASVLLNRLLTRGKFRHVQILLKLAELGSVQRTADAIGTTQSSVTQTLALLEELLQTQLFQRHARGVRPTAACATLLPIARNLMQGLAEGAEMIAAHRAQGQASVRLLASAAAINGVLVRSLPTFHDRAPDIQVHLRELEGEDQLLAIARGEVDLAVCRKPAVLPQAWRFQELQADRLAVVCAANHRLAGTRDIQWKELAGETWLLPPAGTAARERLDQKLAAFDPPVATYPLVTRALALMRWLLVHRNMLSLLPLSFVQHLIDSGELSEIKTPDPMPMEPMGILVPEDGIAEAAARLATFLLGTMPSETSTAAARDRPAEPGGR